MKLPIHHPRTIDRFNRTRLHARSGAQGAGLVEILVALVVSSVGLLGIAALQLGTLRNNFDSTVRTHASVLADDIMDRMRANRNAAVTGEYDLSLSATTPTGSTRAITDLNEWRTVVSLQLPSGRGGISVDPNTHIATVTLDWSERGANGATSPNTIVFTSMTEL